MTLVSFTTTFATLFFLSKRVPPFCHSTETSLPLKKRPCTWPPIKITPPPTKKKTVSCHHFLAFKRLQSLASWSFRLLLGFETSLVLTLHDFQFSANPAERLWKKANTCAESGNVSGMLVVKSNLTSSTEIYAIWVRWKKSTCSIPATYALQISFHWFPSHGWTKSLYGEDRNSSPCLPKAKNYQLTWSLPSFQSATCQSPRKINHPTSNIIQHHPTWSNIITSSNIPPTSPCFCCLPFCLCSQGFHCIVLQAFNPTLNEVTDGQWTQRTFPNGLGFV